MIKRIGALLLIIVMLLVSLSIQAADDVQRKVTEAAYGTPVIDGEIDSVWDKTNYNIVDNCRVPQQKEYKGWFKVLWDENYIYVLSKVYCSQYDDSVAEYFQDSVDVYIDEDCSRGATFESDDYQTRSNFKGYASGSNYDTEKMKTGASLFDGGFFVEMDIPFIKVELKEGLNVGFEVQINASAEPGISFRPYLWNTVSNWVWNKPDCYGTLVLKNTVSVNKFDEPTWVQPSPAAGYVSQEETLQCELVENVNVTYDRNSYTYPVLHVNEYPCMEINELATVIGGEVNGNTLTKDDVSVTFTEGSRLAVYGDGHLMLERTPVVYDGRFYVPVSFVEPSM